MTPDQIHLVQASWRRVKPIQAAAAGLFYGRLFELAPELRPLFTRDIHVQGAMLMRMLDAIVNHLDDLSTLQPAAGELARRHVAYGVQPAHFESVGTALLWTLQQGLGASFDAAAREAWRSAYAVLASVMKEAMKDAVPPSQV